MNSTYRYNNHRSVPFVILLLILLANLFKSLLPIHYLIFLCSMLYMFIGKIIIAETSLYNFTIKRCVIFQSIKVHHSQITSIDVQNDLVFINKKDNKVLKISLSLFTEGRRDDFIEYLSGINKN